MYSVCHFRGIFNVNHSTAHNNTKSTERDEMIEVCGVACKKDFNVNFTAKIFHYQSWFDQVFSSRLNNW